MPSLIFVIDNKDLEHLLRTTGSPTTWSELRLETLMAFQVFPFSLSRKGLLLTSSKDIIGVVPELQFGFTLNFNSDIDVFNVTYDLLQEMLPALQVRLPTNTRVVLIQPHLGCPCVESTICCSITNTRSVCWHLCM